MEKQQPTVIRPSINNKNKYARILIRRSTPEETLYSRPIRDGDDLAERIRIIAEWYRDFQPHQNIMLTLQAEEITDSQYQQLTETDNNGNIVLR